MDATDADGEWSDEEVLRSGSVTGVSETDQEDIGKAAGIGPSEDLFSNACTVSSPLMRGCENGMTTMDPVASILGKIDAELEAMERNKSQNFSRPINGDFPSLSRQHEQLGKGQKRDADQLPSSHVGDRSLHEEKDIYSSIPSVYGGAGLTDDETGRKLEDAPSDLDSASAHQIDLKFKEIMRKKKVPPGLPMSPEKKGMLSSRLKTRNVPRPSAVMLSTGYGTDNDSVKTEDFECKFLNMVVNTSDTERVQAPATARPAMTTLEKNDDDMLQSLRNIAASAESLKPQSIISRPKSLSPTGLRSEKKAVSIIDINPDAKAIERESMIIKREIEQERRSRSASPSPRSSSWNSHVPYPVHNRHSPDPTTGSYVVPQKVVKSPEVKTFTKSLERFSEKEDELIAGHGLKTLRQALMLTRKDLRETEAQLKDAREMSEDAKSSLIVLQFKRGTATKDLERLQEDIKRKKEQMNGLETELQGKINEVKSMHAIGVSKEDCLEAKTVKEENLCLKTKVRNLEGLHLERDELVRQLEAAKEELLREQRQGRLQKAELQEEVENLSAKLEEIQNCWANGQVQTSKLEAAFRRIEKEKNELIQEKTREYEELKSQCKVQTAETHGRLTAQMKELDHEVQELRVRVTDLQGDNSTKDGLIEKLRAQISDMQSVLSKERQERHRVASEQKKALHQLKKETSVAVMKLKESMFLDKQRAIEDLKRELEQEHRASDARCDDNLTKMLTENTRVINDKNDEIVRLQDMVRRMEKDKKIEMEQQIREAVSREREKVEKDKDWLLRQEKEEGKRRTNEMIVQLDREKQANRDLHKELTDLRKELEEQRRQQREASKEKLVAVSRAKDQMRDQINAEVERVKFNLGQVHQEEVDRLQDKIRLNEDELSVLRSERQEAIAKERNALQALEHAERTVISEINEECHKVSSILGISPRTVQNASFHFENDGRSSPSFKNRPVLNTALANMRASSEELHNHIAELKGEIESLRVMVDTVTKQKEEAIENCRLEMEKQRTLDLEKLKEKLLKDHVQEMSNVIRECAETNSELKRNNQHLQRYGDAAMLEALQAKDEELRALQQGMGQWQSDVEEKFATQLQLQMAKEREKYQALQHHSTREQKRTSELQKREIDRLEREVQKLAMSQSSASDSNRLLTSSPTPAAAASGPSPTPASSSHLKSSQHYLQTRIKQLQTENDALRKQRLLAGRHLSSSSPRLANPTPIRPGSPIRRSVSPSRDTNVLQRLEERMRQGEQDSLQAEQRAKMNQHALSHKMAEMTKLQNTLSSQNQELQELEKAYSDLHKQYNSRSCSPIRNLNITM